MTITYKITDGTNTVSLSGTDGLVAVNRIPSVAGRYDDQVEEVVPITLVGGLAEVSATMAELELIFEEARDRFGAITEHKEPYYFVAELDGYEWRAEIFDGSFLSDAEDGYPFGDAYANGVRSGK